MKCISVAALLCFFTGYACSATAGNNEPKISIEAVESQKWNAGSMSLGESSIPFQLFVPTTTKNKMPLVVFLHGSGEAGTDNTKQLYEGKDFGPTFFSRSENQGKHPCYILAPQTPEPIRWANTTPEEYDVSKTPVTSSMKLLLASIDALVETGKIDSQRIYIGGLSRGGQGAWNACLLRPDLFASAFPMCGSASPQFAYVIKDMPIWTFHGDSDRVCSVEYTRGMVKALYDAGASEKRVRYSEYKGGQHADGWIQAHKERGFIDWIFSWKNENPYQKTDLEELSHMERWRGTK